MARRSALRSPSKTAVTGRSVVEVQEGKYHQVRRMLASRGMPVTYLRREAEGRLTLGDLPLGQTKELNIVEAEQLLLNIL